MARNNISSVISIDSNSKTVTLCLLNGNRVSVADAINCDVSSYNEDFFDSFSRVIKSFREKFPEVNFQRTGIVMPDELFFSDTVSVPLISKRALGRSIDLALGALYKNIDELDIHTFLLSQNKQYATYGLVGMRREILAFVQKACKENNIEIAGISSRSGCLANGAMAVMPKLKNETFLFVDIKEESTAFVFVFKGQAVGCYDLPFGCSILRGEAFISERLLFEYSSAEKLVCDVKRKAKSEQTTDAIGRGEGYEDFCKNTVYDPKDCDYINFRIFVKWCLELIANNTSVLPTGSFGSVYVNMPNEYGYLLEKVNTEIKENKVEFVRFTAELTDESISKNIELFGGFYIGQHNKPNTF